MNNEKPTAENPPAVKPDGESPPGAIPQQAAPATLAAGGAAFDQHIAETTKRGRGRPITHGRYAGQQRKKPSEIPLGKMGNGAAPVLLEDFPAQTVPIGVEQVQPAFNDEINREYAGIAIDLLVTVKNASTRKRIFKETENQEFTDLVMAKKDIGEKPRQALQTGLVACARKYNLDLSQTPEGMVIGGLLVYLAQDGLNTRAAIAEYFKLRPQEAKP